MYNYIYIFSEKKQSIEETITNNFRKIPKNHGIYPKKKR